MTLDEQLKAIVPGKTYPSSVKITETDNNVIEFFCQSYYVGMYCAIHFSGNIASQTGDRNNKTFCAKLKKDISKAIGRGAKVEIGSIRNCQLDMPK